ncbi:MAG: OstA-like protein [Balneolaceae bacterium]
MVRICFVIITLVFLSLPLRAQDIVELIRFDSATLTEVDGERVQKLINARMSMRDVTMICDSAFRYLDRDEMRAFGNIQIDTETENIWADTLYYYSNDEISLLRGRVIIRQDSTTLFGKKVEYNFETKVAYFPSGIRLEDNKGTLIAKNGTYFQNQDSAIFRFDVQLEDSSQYAESDSMFINRERNYLQMYSNVFVSDSVNEAILTGEYLEADSTGRRYTRDKAYLMSIESDSSNADTTHIFANEILLLEQDSTSTIEGIDSVKVWTAKFSSLSDTLFFDSESEIFTLSGSPKSWNKQTQLTGPFIVVELDSSEIKKLSSYPYAFSVQQDTITMRLNQLKGDTLIAYFDAGDISRIELFPYSQILYHTRNEDDEPDGAMEYTSPTTTLFFENGDLVQAKMGQNEGLFLPEYTDLANRTLDGFSWNPDLRPQKPIIIPGPRFNPIPTNKPFSLPERYLRFLSDLEDLN